VYLLLNDWFKGLLSFVYRNYILFAIEVVRMYWKFINLRIIIEICGFIVVFWFVEIRLVLNLPRECHVSDM
jgi:hypothetical protein